MEIVLSRQSSTKARYHVSMKVPRYTILLVGAALTLGSFGLHAEEETATKSFTLALSAEEKVEWEKEYNALLARSFLKLDCPMGEKNTVPLGKGCVDAGTMEICCKEWEANLQCNAKLKWEHKGLEGDHCLTKKKEKQAESE